MIYFPPHLKYTEVAVDMHDNRPPQHVKVPVKSEAWRLSIILSWVVFVHMYVPLILQSVTVQPLTQPGLRMLITFVSFLLLATNPADPSQRGTQISAWATFLGVTSALLAAMQYAPQLVHTYRLKLVGALSIKMMLMQSPGAILMVTSIALRYVQCLHVWLSAFLI